jgi:LDH2 family malate/lactate/ureidoglycolate dehydrogenase
MIIRTAEALRQLTCRILSAAGADRSNAEEVARHLVLANLRGVDTHGIWHIPGYVQAIRAGQLAPEQKPAILEESPNTALISGHWTFGQVAARFAMETAIRKASREKVALVGLVQAHHVGRLGHYAEMAAAERMISMVWVGGLSENKPRVMPFGGSRPLLHTNPIALGIPAGEEPPMVADFATSAISGVKVDNAFSRGESLPPGCIVDKEGRPTTHPADFFDGGGHTPFGQHKGWAIMLAAEFLSRILLGSDSFADPQVSDDVLRHQGDTFLVIRADLFQPYSTFARRADEMQQRVRAVPPAPGFEQVRVPGDPEVETQARREREGVPIVEDVWQRVVETAESLGIDEC